jgi:hypothetical protein
MTKTTRGRRRQFGPGLVALVLVGAATLGGGCNQAHLSPNYGLSFNAWFPAQYVRSQPADSEATHRALGSLDAQEAAAVSKNYRRASAGGQGDAQSSEMLMVSQQRGGNEAYTPPPSVPGGN